MIIMNEYTGETHDTVEECLAAEKDFLRKKEAKEKAKKEHQEALDKAYKEAIAACDRYLELAGIKVEDDEDGFRCFRFTVDDDDDLFEKIAEIFL